MKLSEIELNRKARVIKIENAESIKRRLNNLGFYEGVIISVIKKAPFGCPIELNIGNFNLAIRVFDAEKITVEYVK